MTEEELTELLLAGFEDDYICYRAISSYAPRAFFYTPGHSILHTVGTPADKEQVHSTLEQLGFSLSRCCWQMRKEGMHEAYTGKRGSLRAELRWNELQGTPEVGAVSLLFFLARKHSWAYGGHFSPDVLQQRVRSFIDFCEHFNTECSDIHQRITKTRKKLEISQATLNTLLRHLTAVPGRFHTLHRDWEGSPTLRIRAGRRHCISLHLKPESEGQHLSEWAALNTTIERLSSALESFGTLQIRVLAAEDISANRDKTAAKSISPRQEQVEEILRSSCPSLAYQIEDKGTRYLLGISLEHQRKLLITLPRSIRKSRLEHLSESIDALQEALDSAGDLEITVEGYGSKVSWQQGAASI